ncbi:Fur family transcriptional regulator [Candidatus Neomarinimicrobiota bacterium]
MMRNSKQREIILGIVQNTLNHPTADWIYNMARRENPNISLGTIYRNLGQLVDNNTLKTVNIDGTLHYDAMLVNHQHFQCKTCNQVFDIEIDTKDFVLKIESNTKHKIDRCQIHFVGICKNCQGN